MGLLQIKFLNQSTDFKRQFQNVNFFKIILFGMLFAISWTPCVGTFLSSALMLVAREQDMGKGILLIFTYSLGLGVPFIISAVLIEQLKSAFAFIKNHYSTIKKISGLILIGMGIYMIFF